MQLRTEQLRHSMFQCPNVGGGQGSKRCSGHESPVWGRWPLSRWLRIDKQAERISV